MAQIFPKIINHVAKASIVVVILVATGFLLTIVTISRSPYVTQAKVYVEQPVLFSHEHHVSEVGIDCRFCHTGVEDSAFAGIPPTSTCMTCHSQLFADSPLLEPVRNSFETGQPLQWTRVNDLPDFVYFDHSIHVNKGVACVTCHGPIGEMPLLYRYNAQDMTWCLECHRNPEAFVRPPQHVFSTTYDREQHTADVEAWIQKADLNNMTHCSTCHR